MDLDPLSIIAPARVKVLLLPVGVVKRSRFASFVERLQQANVVRLGDVSPDSRPHRTTFSPLAFPDGLVLYDLSTSVPPPTHVMLAPFEIYRQTLAVVGLADGIASGLNPVPIDAGIEADIGNGEDNPKVNGLRTLVRSLENLIDDFPNALVHQVLVFDHDDVPMPERIYPVPAIAKSKTTTIKTVMCDLTSRLLAEMSNYAKSFQGLSFLESPHATPNAAVTSSTVLSLQAQMSYASKAGSTRSSSPSRDRSKLDHRASMLGNLPSGSAAGVSTPVSRPTSPHNENSTPPISFDDITGSTVYQSPPKTSNHDRADSRGRASGLGTSSLVEREKSKGKARVGIVIGSLYLLAGRWPDAVKELVQSGGVARNCSDYLWHAKAMDYVLVCLLMYAWTGMDFHIPENLFPGTEKPGSSSSKMSKQTLFNNSTDANVTKSTDPVSRAASLRTLTNLLPDLTNSILNLFTRAWTFTDDKIPQLAFSQSAIRFAKLLSALHACHGLLDDALLRHLVLNAEIPSQEQQPSGNPVFLPRAAIVELLFRGYPGYSSESSMDSADRINILAGIASVLSQLGYSRKKAIVLKELTTALLPALVQARKDGAAEMGVHPAASLSSLGASMRAISLGGAMSTSDDSDQGMRHFLSLLCQSYGIVSVRLSNNQYLDVSETNHSIASKKSTESSHAQLINVAVINALHEASAKASGSQDLKIEVLRSCINVCEALPDLGGALQYSAELLRIGGSGIVPGPDSSDGAPDLVVEEQVRLVNNISRTLSAAKQLGFEHPEAGYWDEFLVRGIEAVYPNSPRILQSHEKSELDLVETMDAKNEKTPFIYNPFVKCKDSTSKELLLVSGEEAFFLTTLQNLYDFDVAIEWVKLLADGVPFECEAQSALIGAYRTQTIILSGTPRETGTVAVHGCLAKIKGCRQQAFPTFAEPWALKPDVKGRHLGLPRKSRPLSSSSVPGKVNKPAPSKGPVASVLVLKVLEAQPRVTLKSVSAPQAAIMLLDGESKSLTFVLQNLSLVAPVDLLLLSFDDSTASQRDTILSSKELSADKLYEVELDSARKALRWNRKEEDGDFRIDPGGDITLEIEALGMLGLSNGTIKIDYSHLGVPRAEIKEKFYTRQLILPLTMTVNASIHIVGNDIVALPSEFISSKPPQHNPFIREPANSNLDVPSSTPTHDYHHFLNHIHSSPTRPYCLLLLDLRNLWSNTLVLTLEISDPCQASPITHSQRLQPGTTYRVPIPLPRLYNSNPHAPIPALNSANKRQFVISATTTSPEAERVMREAFWYKEALLALLNATWREESTGRRGDIDLRRLRLSPRMLSSLRLPDLEIGMSVTSAEPEVSPPLSHVVESVVKNPSASNYTVPMSTFLNLNTQLYNRSDIPIRPILRLQPKVAHQPPNTTLDLSKKLLVNGLLQRVLPSLGPGERCDIETGFLVLNRGIYEWRAIVEETVAPGKMNGADSVPKKRATTGDLDVLGDIGRRTWVAEEPCIVEVKTD